MVAAELPTTVARLEDGVVRQQMSVAGDYRAAPIVGEATANNRFLHASAQVRQSSSALDSLEAACLEIDLRPEFSTQVKECLTSSSASSALSELAASSPTASLAVQLAATLCSAKVWFAVPHDGQLDVMSASEFDQWQQTAEGRDRRGSIERLHARVDVGAGTVSRVVSDTPPRPCSSPVWRIGIPLSLADRAAGAHEAAIDPNWEPTVTFRQRVNCEMCRQAGAREWIPVRARTVVDELGQVFSYIRATELDRTVGSPSSIVGTVQLSEFALAYQIDRGELTPVAPFYHEIDVAVGAPNPFNPRLASVSMCSSPNPWTFDPAALIRAHNEHVALGARVAKERLCAYLSATTEWLPSEIVWPSMSNPDHSDASAIFLLCMALFGELPDDEKWKSVDALSVLGESAHVTSAFVSKGCLPTTSVRWAARVPSYPLLIAGDIPFFVGVWDRDCLQVRQTNPSEYLQRFSSITTFRGPTLAPTNDISAAEAEVRSTLGSDLSPEVASSLRRQVVLLLLPVLAKADDTAAREAARHLLLCARYRASADSSQWDYLYSVARGLHVRWDTDLQMYSEAEP
ncbi:MAG: hypothetical protein IT459_06705 [Planctomycetes bacterium]|nr:hypothetical protein [Planctomycetota bacterium]